MNCSISIPLNIIEWNLLLFSSFIDKRLCEHHILNIILPHHHMFNYLTILKICCLCIGLNKHPCNNASMNDQKENVFLNFNTWQIVRLVIAISKYILYCQCVVGPKHFLFLLPIHVTYPLHFKRTVLHIYRNMCMSLITVKVL